MRKLIDNFISYFTEVRWVLIALYVFLFLFSFSSVLITRDEYDGGDRIADFGTWLSDIFSFPVFTIWEWFQIPFGSDNFGWIILGFIVNLVINCFLFVTIVERFFRLFRFKKKAKLTSE